MEKCLMCKSQLESDDVTGMCKKCMFEVWGGRMSNYIRERFVEAKRSGTLLNQE